MRLDNEGFIHVTNWAADPLQVWLVVVRGQGPAMLESMQRTEAATRFAPVYHAVAAAMEGDDYLLRINPEVRQPTQAIYEGVARLLKLYPTRR